MLLRLFNPGKAKVISVVRRQMTTTLRLNLLAMLRQVTATMVV